MPLSRGLKGFPSMKRTRKSKQNKRLPELAILGSAGTLGLCLAAPADADIIRYTYQAPVSYASPSEYSSYISETMNVVFYVNTEGAVPYSHSKWGDGVRVPIEMMSVSVEGTDASWSGMWNDIDDAYVRKVDRWIHIVTKFYNAHSYQTTHDIDIRFAGTGDWTGGDSDMFSDYHASGLPLSFDFTNAINYTDSVPAYFRAGSWVSGQGWVISVVSDATANSGNTLHGEVVDAIPEPASAALLGLGALAALRRRKQHQHQTV